MKWQDQTPEDTVQLSGQLTTWMHACVYHAYAEKQLLVQNLAEDLFCRAEILISCQLHTITSRWGQGKAVETPSNCETIYSKYNQDHIAGFILMHGWKCLFIFLENDLLQWKTPVRYLIELPAIYVGYIKAKLSMKK